MLCALAWFTQSETAAYSLARRKTCMFLKVLLPQDWTEYIMETHDRDIALGPKRYFYLYNRLNERSWQSNWLHQLSFSHRIIWHNQEVLQQQLWPRPFACQGQVLLRYRYDPLKQKAKQLLTCHTLLSHLWHWGHTFFDCVYTPFVHNFLAYNFFLLLKKSTLFRKCIENVIHIQKHKPTNLSWDLISWTILSTFFYSFNKYFSRIFTRSCRKNLKSPN